MDVVQDGRSLKLGVSWRARLIVPTCNNCKHLAYMSLLRVSRNTGVKETKITGTGDQSSTLLGVRLHWSSHVPTENVSWMLFKRDMADLQQQLAGSLIGGHSSVTWRSAAALRCSAGVMSPCRTPISTDLQPCNYRNVKAC